MNNREQQEFHEEKMEWIVSLQSAVLENDFELLQSLLLQKAGKTDKIPKKYQIKGNGGDTPLHWSSFRGEVEITKLLLQYEVCDFDSQNYGQETPLHYASKEGKITIINLLLSYGANPNLQNNDGKTCLHYACEKNQIKSAEELLAYSNSEKLVFIRDNEGNTVLHVSCEQCDKELVILLLGYANELYKIPNNRLETPLHILASKNNIILLKIMIDHAEYNDDFSFIDSKNIEQQSALHVACFNRRFELIMGINRSWSKSKFT